MDRQDLEFLLNKTPFIPFRLTVSTNESFDVRHPELAFVMDRFVAIGRITREGEERSMLIYWISLQHIVHFHRLT
jgi:hypothetical protein